MKAFKRLRASVTAQLMLLFALLLIAFTLIVSILYNALMEEYSHIGSKRERYNQIKKNPYFNALQVKYGYAVTCHKAQGGEWRNVFIDLSYINPDYLGDNFYRWLYTSITRSTKMLYLVNLADDFVADSN